MGEITYVSGWRKRDTKIEKDAVETWHAYNAMPEGVSPEERAREICCLAYDGNTAAGISTIEIKPCRPLRNRLFGYLRVFTLPDYEQQEIAIRLAINCRDTLEAWALEHPGEKLCGMAAVYQSPKLGPTPVGKSGLTLIGYTPQGFQHRIVWFPHIRL